MERTLKDTQSIQTAHAFEKLRHYGLPTSWPVFIPEGDIVALVKWRRMTLLEEKNRQRDELIILNMCLVCGRWISETWMKYFRTHQTIPESTLQEICAVAHQVEGISALAATLDLEEKDFRKELKQDSENLYKMTQGCCSIICMDIYHQCPKKFYSKYDSKFLNSISNENNK